MEREWDGVPQWPVGASKFQYVLNMKSSLLRCEAVYVIVCREVFGTL